MEFIKSLMINPLSQWLKRLVVAYYYQIKYSTKHLKIGYLSNLNNCKFGMYNSLHPGVMLCNVTMGDFSYIAENSRLVNVNLGKFSCIGPDVLMGLGKHPSHDFVSIHPIFFSTSTQSEITFLNKTIFDESSPITVGNDVWIGARAIVLDGITIGDGAIIGAGAVVTKDIPPYAIVGGVPAKIIRYRFDKNQIDLLLNCKWWHRDINWLSTNAKHFQSIHVFAKNLKRTNNASVDNI